MDYNWDYPYAMYVRRGSRRGDKWYLMKLWHANNPAAFTILARYFWRKGEYRRYSEVRVVKVLPGFAESRLTAETMESIIPVWQAYPYLYYDSLVLRVHLHRPEA